MKLQMVGCSHHNAALEVRERLAFSPDQARRALSQLKDRFPGAESVLISTCNRVEVYTAAEDPDVCPSPRAVVDFVAEFHGLDSMQVFGRRVILGFDRSCESADHAQVELRRLFRVLLLDLGAFDGLIQSCNVHSKGPVD